MNLEDLRVASPCHESWEKMKGDERARHCAKCDHAVYNISNMTWQEAEALVRSREGMERTCIRFHRRFDGTLITRDCPVGVRKRRLVWIGLATGSAAMVGALTAVISAAKPSGHGSVPLRGVYLDAKDRTSDWIAHKFGIPSLCNCRRFTMGAIILVPPAGSVPPSFTPPSSGP